MRITTDPDEVANDLTGIYFDEHGEYYHLADCSNATPSAVSQVLNALPGDDTRSKWKWLRLANGDLMLGVFPHGEMYDILEETVYQDFKGARNTDQRKKPDPGKISTDLDKILDQHGEDNAESI